jgi:sulfofructose kinase
MKNSYDVVGLGIASWDMIGSTSREPLLGAKQPLESWIEASGGPVATALVTLARFGMRTCLVSAVGDDTYGSRIIADLRQEGVETNEITIHSGASHVAFVLVEPEHSRRTVWWHNDRSVLEKIEMNRQTITSARALHIDTHLPECALQAAQWMREAGGLVLIDAERYSERTAHVLPFCDAIVVSERFGREATGEQDIRQAAQDLFGRYSPLVVVVTAGERGSWCVHQNESFHTPAFPCTIVDTTGAGDVFHGAFLYGLLRHWSFREIVRFASATAALKCRAFGGRAGIPQREEVFRLLEQTEQDTHPESKSNLSPTHGNALQ